MAKSKRTTALNCFLVIGVASVLAVSAVNIAPGNQPRVPSVASPMFPDDRALPNADRPREFAVVGKVLDETGTKPMAGVRLTAHAGYGSLFKTGETVTDKDGRFRLSFRPGVMFSGAKVGRQVAIIAATKPGFYSWTYGTPAEFILSDRQLVDGELWPGHEGKIEFRMAPAARL